jgi:FkbM family methyltransferase
MIKKIKYFINKILETKIKITLHPLRDGVERIGTEYGSWVIPKGLLDQNSICYGVGAGLDISFDIGLVKKYGCPVHIFDPTPRAINHFELLLKNTAAGKPTHTNNTKEYTYQVTTEELEKLHFHPIGLWNEDTTLKFYAPVNEMHISHSAVNLQRTQKYFEANVQQLSTIMNDLGHNKLDLLKLDIEGAEYQVIESIVQHKIKISVLCIEFDETARNNFDQKYIQRIQQALDSLLAIGYLGVYIDDDFNFTLVHESIYAQLA